MVWIPPAALARQHGERETVSSCGARGSGAGARRSGERAGARAGKQLCNPAEKAETAPKARTPKQAWSYCLQLCRYPAVCGGDPPVLVSSCADIQLCVGATVQVFSSVCGSSCAVVPSCACGSSCMVVSGYACGSSCVVVSSCACEPSCVLVSSCADIQLSVGIQLCGCPSACGSSCADIQPCVDPAVWWYPVVHVDPAVYWYPAVWVSSCGQAPAALSLQLCRAPAVNCSSCARPPQLCTPPTAHGPSCARPWLCGSTAGYLLLFGALPRTALAAWVSSCA